MSKLLACILLFAFLITSCTVATSTEQPFGQFILVTQDANSLSTLTPFQPSGEVSAPVPTWTPQPMPADTATLPPTQVIVPTDTALPPTVPAMPPTQPLPPLENPSRPNYVLYVTLDFKNHVLYANETIRYYNGTGMALSDMVLAVEPNLWTGAFTLNSITQDNVAITSYALNGQNLSVTLPTQIQPGTSTTLALMFTLNIPDKGSGLFGYDFNQINLVDWYPFIVPYQGGWILHDPASFGEHLVYDAADIEVNLKTDADVIVAASAPAEQNGEWTRYRIYGARTFAISASNEFLFSESAVGSTIIRSYYFNGYKAASDSILYSAVQAVSIYEAKFAPYPYQTLAIVEADIHDGEEYDGLVFVSSKFYGEYGGGAKNNLTTIGVHEIAHQWWFGLVGNDQALQPWLDEALAIYSEEIFYEYNYPRYGNWWWGFRVDYFGPSGDVDSTVYSQPTFRAYTNAVYLNGAHFIQDLRVLMGDDNFFHFLKDYAARFSRGRATSQDFFNVVREHTSADLRYLISEYFSQSY